MESFALFSFYKSVVVEVTKDFRKEFSNHDYLSGFLFDFANKSQLTDHFKQLTHLTNLQYILYERGLQVFKLGFNPVNNKVKELFVL